MELTSIKKALNENVELVFKKLNVEYEIFGDNVYSKCPIHEGSDNPRALSFSIDKGIWKCWTRDCQFHYRNDIFGLIAGVLSSRSHKEQTFSDALKWSCELLNIKHKGGSSSNKKVIIENDPFIDTINILSECDKEIHHDAIKVDFDLSTPSEYFISRGFDYKTLEYFQISDCTDKGPMYDRAVIPIHNDDGTNVIGLIGRTTKEYKKPKFLFHPKGFDKRYCLYNYHRAINSIERTHTLFIVEGQGDVWKLYEAGVTNVVSILGKTITKEQESKINKMPITKIVILTDNDQAGRESKVQIKRQFGRMYKLIFPKMTSKDIGEMKIKDIKTLLNGLEGSY